MSATVNLSEIVDALQMQFDESSSFLDLDTGEVETVSHDLLHAAEVGGDEEPDLPAWQRGEWEAAIRIVSTDRFRKLPTKFDAHEWAIMEEFALAVESERVREDLRAPSTAPAPSGVSKVCCGGAASSPPGLHSATRR